VRGHGCAELGHPAVAQCAGWELGGRAEFSDWLSQQPVVRQPAVEAGRQATTLILGWSRVVRVCRCGVPDPRVRPARRWGAGAVCWWLTPLPYPPVWPVRWSGGAGVGPRPRSVGAGGGSSGACRWWWLGKYDYTRRWPELVRRCRCGSRPAVRRGGGEQQVSVAGGGHATTPVRWPVRAAVWRRRGVQTARPVVLAAAAGVRRWWWLATDHAVGVAGEVVRWCRCGVPDPRGTSRWRWRAAGVRRRWWPATDNTPLVWPVRWSAVQGPTRTIPCCWRWRAAGVRRWWWPTPPTHPAGGR
jgi:hypothetical protein